MLIPTNFDLVTKAKSSSVWTVWLDLYRVAGIDPFVKSGIPDLNGNSGHQVFAVKICCTQTPGARPFVLLQLAPTPINGKAQRLVDWWLDGHREHR